MADVFISYSEEDKAEAQLLSALLEASGYTVWWDNNLKAGAQFRKVIASELTKARAVIVIWTKNSVASEWVQSEAGRAHGNQKLLPVRSSEIKYEEIPPPFENVHTLRLNQTEQILAAVADQLAKPASAGPRWKVFRYKLLLWAGVFGGAITLTNIISSVFTMSAALSWVLTNWSVLLKYFWQAVLFFKVDVSPYDAELLTIAVLLTTAVFYATSRQSETAGRKLQTKLAPKARIVRFFSLPLSILSHLAPLIIIWIIMAIGTLQIGGRETTRAQTTWMNLVDQIFVDRLDCALAIKAAIKPSILDARMELPSRKRQIDECLERASRMQLTESERTFLAEYPPKLKIGKGSVWIAFVTSAPTETTSVILALAAMFSPILLPFVLYFIVRSIVPLKLQVSVLSRRLWRTLALFGGILILNLVVLSLEDWLKSIPRELS